MAYEIWNQESANIVGVYSSGDAALRMVAATIEKYGEEAASQWALAFEDAEGETTLIADGAALIDQARGTVTA